MNPFKTPESEIEKGDKYWRPFYFVFIVHLYYWPKLLHYVYILYDREFLDVMRASINVPVYISILLYLFKIRFGNQKVWKILIVIAFSDEILNAAQITSSVRRFMSSFPYYLLPLYLFSFVYAFRSSEIWSDSAKSNH